MIKSPHRARLGLCLPEGRQDVFWVQVYDAIYKRGTTLPVELIPLGIGGISGTTATEQRLALLDDIATQELDVLIGWPFPESLVHTLLESGLAIVHLSETDDSHPLSVSPLGLGKVAEEVAEFLAEDLGGQGEILVVGDLLHHGMPDDGKSRIAGIARVLHRYPRIRFQHILSDWHPNEAGPQIDGALSNSACTFDAVIGLSDTLALLARDIARERGRCAGDVKVVGINGDPMAIAAILEGSMLATIETSSAHLGAQAVELACSIAYDRVYDPHFGYQTRLITARSAPRVALEKLLAIDQLMNIPFELRESERLEHLAHLETSLNISRRLSTVLDENELPTVLGIPHPRCLRLRPPSPCLLA